MNRGNPENKINKMEIVRCSIDKMNKNCFFHYFNAFLFLSFFKLQSQLKVLPNQGWLATFYIHKDELPPFYSSVFFDIYILVLITISSFASVHLISINNPHRRLPPSFFIDNSLLMFSCLEPKKNLFFELVLSAHRPPTCDLQERFITRGCRLSVGGALTVE